MDWPLVDFLFCSQILLIKNQSKSIRVVHGSDGPAGQVTILQAFGGSGRVKNSFFYFLLIISWFLNQYESSNSTLGLIVFILYLIYIISK